MACEIHSLSGRPEYEESAVPRAAPGVGMHQEGRVFLVIKELKGLMLRGVLLMLVEAVRIDFLSTLGKKKKKGEKLLLREGSIRDSPPAFHTQGNLLLLDTPGQDLCPRC